MAIKLNFHGVELITSTVAEAAELARALTEHKPPTPVRSENRVKISPLEKRKHNGFDVARATADFLGVIAAAAPHGAAAEDLMGALHVNKTKGIGGRAARINGLLYSLGFAPDEVYDNARTADGRFWRRGPKLQEAMEAVSMKLL